MGSPARDGKYFLPCLSIMFPISGSETWSAGCDAAEGQARSTGNGDELESQIPQKHTKSKISSDQAQSNADHDSHMSELILQGEMGEAIHATCDKIFFHLLLPIF